MKILDKNVDGHTSANDSNRTISYSQGVHIRAIMIRLFFFSLVLIAIAATFFGYKYWQDNYPNRVVATVGGQEIFQKDFSALSGSFGKFAAFNSDNKLAQNYKTEALDRLIMEKALENEAKKRNIVVTTEEINEKYQEVVSTYKTEEEFRRAIKAAYDWKPEYTKQELKIEIFQEKLEPYLLNSKTVWGPYLRWDWNGTVPSEQQNIDIATAREKFTNTLLPSMEAGADKSKIYASIMTLRDQDSFYEEPETGVMNFTNLNENNYKGSFVGSDEWNEIKKLSKVGDMTPIIKSEGGFFAAFRLVRANNGQYENWGEFLDKTKKDSKISSISVKLEKAQYDVAILFDKYVPAVENNISKILAPALALAGNNDKIDCTINHFSRIESSQSDSAATRDGVTGLAISGATVTADHAANNTFVAGVGKWKKCNSGEDGSASTTTDSHGRFGLGTQKDPNKKKLSCFTRWNISITHPNYYPVTYDKKSVNGNGVTGYIDDMTDGTEVKGTYTGAYFAAENTNGNGIIKMQPVPPPCAPAASQTQSIACPACNSGTINQKRDSSCPGPTYGSWYETSRSCAIITYTLSYNSNGGSPNPPTSSHNCGSGATVGNAPTKAKWSFGGWYKNSSLVGTKYSPGNTILMNSNKTLYAKWDPTSCSIAMAFTPTSMDANTGTPTLTASVSQGTSGSINFGNGNSSTISNLSGANTYSPTYNGFGVYTATANCTGTDGVTHNSSANFTLKKIQSACTVSAIATSINGGTGNFVSDNASGYTVTSINNGAVDLNMTTVAAATTGAVSEYWTSTNGLNNSSNKVTKKSSGAYSPWAGAVNTLRFANPDTYTITTQCFTPDQYGSYSPPGNPGSTATKKVILNRPACKYNDPLNPIKVEASSYNTASGHPMASNMNPSTIKFSANNLSGVGATGFIQWDLYNGVTPISHTGQASTDSPSITYYFSGSGTGDRSGRDSSNTLPATATYTVKLIASSMTDAFGGVILPRPSDPGNCDSNVAVTVDRGPEIACDMSPSSGGIVPQAISVTVRADSSVYRNNANDFTLNWNSHTKSFNGSLDNSFSPARIIATVSQMLENTGKYNISVVATKLDGSKEAPFACGGLDLTGSCPWGTGKCNYVVTNPGGGGGGEVAP